MTFSLFFSPKTAYFSLSLLQWWWWWWWCAIRLTITLPSTLILVHLLIDSFSFYGRKHIGKKEWETHDGNDRNEGSLSLLFIFFPSSSSSFSSSSIVDWVCPLSWLSPPPPPPPPSSATAVCLCLCAHHSRFSSFPFFPAAQQLSAATLSKSVFSRQPPQSVQPIDQWPACRSSLAINQRSLIRRQQCSLSYSLFPLFLLFFLLLSPLFLPFSSN